MIGNSHHLPTKFPIISKNPHHVDSGEDSGEDGGKNNAKGVLCEEDQLQRSM